MADHYLEFSETLPHLTDEQIDWLRNQLETIHVIDAGGGLCPNCRSDQVEGDSADFDGAIARNVSLALTVTPYGSTSTPCLPLNPETDAGITTRRQ